MGLRGALGKLAYRNFIRYEDIRPAPTAAELPTLSYTQFPLPRNYISGAQISNNGVDADHDIDVAAGQLRNTGDTGNILITSSITKRLDATWASGTGNGGLNDTDQPVATGTWYHVFALGKTTNDAYDVGFDTDPDATNLLADAAVVAAGFTIYRRLGTIKTDGTSNILAFTQTGRHFEWDDPIGNALTNQTHETELTFTLDGAPPDFSTLLDIQWHINEGNNVEGYFYSTNVLEEDPNITNTAPYAMMRQAGPVNLTGRTFIRSNTSRQIHGRFDAGAGTDISFVNIAVFGWQDDLGVYD